MDTIRTEGLTRRFGDQLAVDGMTLSVAAGEIFGLVGPDGAGKTTTMRMLAGILPPSAGDAWVDGLHVMKDAEEIKERIGYMSQRFGLYSDLSVQENLDFYADVFEVPERERAEKTERLLAFSQLAPFRKRRAGHLSGGMKQKLGLACALIHTPRVLFLDEPTNGVDPVSRRDFWRILYQLLHEGVTIFVSTAYLDEAERCGRLGLLHQGRLLACGTANEIKALMRGALLEVRCDRPREAVKLFPSGQATLCGDRLHVQVEEADPGCRSVEAMLRSNGVSGVEIRPVRPSLEDVFLSSISGEKV